MTEQPGNEQPHSSDDDHNGEEGHHEELGGSSQEEGWYQVIRIVSERKRKSRKEYKVSWALNPKTGKEYPDEWVSASSVNDKALRDWERQKEKKRHEKLDSGKPSRLETRPSPDERRIQSSEYPRSRQSSFDPFDTPAFRSTEHFDDHSQPVLPAHLRKRPRATSASTSHESTPGLADDGVLSPKRFKFDRTVSSESSSSGETFTEAFSDLDAAITNTFYIDLSEFPDIDRSEYESVSPLKGLSSQSQSQSHSISALESEDAQVVLVSSGTQKTIPDSSNLDDSALAQEGTLPSQGRTEISDSQKDSSLEDLLTKRSSVHSSSGVELVRERAEQTQDRIKSACSPPSSLSIPSRQLDDARAPCSQASFIQGESISDQTHGAGVQDLQESPLPQEEPSSLRFLTQPPFTIEFSPLSSLPLKYKETVTDSAGLSDAVAANAEISRSDQSPSQQLAQVVPPLFPDSQGQISHSSSSSSPSSNVVPDTVPRRAGRTSIASSGGRDPPFTSSPVPVHSLVEVASSSALESFHTPGQSQDWSSQQDSPICNMDSTSGTPKERSAVDILKEAVASPYTSSKPLSTSGSQQVNQDSEMPEPSDSAMPAAIVTQKTTETITPDMYLASQSATSPEVVGVDDAAAVRAVEHGEETSVLSAPIGEIPGTGLSAEEELLAAVQPAIQIDLQPSEVSGEMSPPTVPRSSYSVPNAGQPQPSIGSAVQAADLSMEVENPAVAAMSGALLEAEHVDSLPRTISPSEISRSIEPSSNMLPPIPIEISNEAVGLNDVEIDEVLPRPQSASSPVLDTISSIQTGSADTNEFVVTLQLPAHICPLYLDTMIRDRREVELFNKARVNDEFVEPGIVAKIDALFDNLLDICDLPSSLGATEMRQLSSSHLAKHAVGTNSKFFFTCRFLEQLASSSKKVLIVARSQAILGYLEAIVSTIDGVAYSGKGLEDLKPSDGSELCVVLAKTDQPVANAKAFDVVIGFDSGFASSSLAQQLEDVQFPKPMVLQLAITFSIEHFELAIPRDMEALDRKNAMLISLFQSRARMSNYEGPFLDQVVAEFAGQVLDFDPSFVWEPEEIPSDYLDFYQGTQQTQAPPETQLANDEPTGRKRKNDEPEDVSAKRLRRSQSPTQASASLEAIHGQIDPDPSLVQVTISKAELNALSDKAAQLEAQLAEKDELESLMRKQITRMSKQIKSHESTTKVIQQKHLELLAERARFEKESHQAQAAETTALQRLKESEAKVTDLEAKLTQVTNVQIDAGHQVLAELREKTKELETLRDEELPAMERRVTSRDATIETFQREVWNERDRHSKTVAETTKLREEIEGLKRRIAGEKNEAMQIKELRRLATEMQTLAREREAELERVREELKMSKNGRRETRGSSVPRSPRLGVMSPRPGGRGPISVPGSGAGSVSRGTSPAVGDGPTTGVMGSAATAPLPAGSQFFNTPAPANGRFNHLRDFP